MYDATVRDAAVRERLAQSLADYYYRRTLGIVCFDPRPPDTRAEFDALYRRKVALARHTLNKLLAARGPGADEAGRRRENVIRWPYRPACKGVTLPLQAPALGERLRLPAHAQALASSTSSMATGLPL